MLDLVQRRFRKMPGQFRSNVWDPVLIIAQIIAMQCQFYVTLGLFVFVLNFICSYDTSIDLLFKQADKGFLATGTGKVNTLAYALNCLTSSLGLWWVVCRTKQCLDFSLTVHLFHFAACWIYNGHIPLTLSWLIINLVGITLMTVLGEFLCMRTEIKAIPLSMGPKVDL